jgi:predicted PurR-regulated permease PerM
VQLRSITMAEPHTERVPAPQDAGATQSVPPSAGAGRTDAIPDSRDPAATQSDSRIPRWVVKAIVLWFAVAVGTVAAVLLVRRLRDLIIWLIAALFLSFAIEPGVNVLVRRGWRRGAATGLILFSVMLVLGVMVALMVPLVVDQVQQLINRAPEWLDKANIYTERWFNLKITGRNIVDYITSAKANIATAASKAAAIGAFMLGLLFQVLTIGLFTFYLVADGPRFRRSILSVFTPRRQLEVLQVWELAIDKTGGYLYSRLLLAVINATFSYIALELLHIPNPLPLALWQGFVSQFIPVVGTYLAAAVPLLVALLSDPWSALFFLIFVVVYQQIENYIFSPRITARTMQLHPAIAFGAALAGGLLSGLLGAFMALPAAAVIQATVSSYLTRHEVLETDLTREHVELGPADKRPRRPFLRFFRRRDSGEG